MQLPDAIYVGMSKAGSTYIYQVLKEHTAVFVPEIKDTYFFDRAYQRGLEWYSGFFAKARAGQVKVELSHDYIFSPEATARIKQDLPAVKIIICLREPVDWVISRYAFELERRKDVGALDLSEGGGSYWLRQESDIAINVQRYLQTFDRQNILFLFYEDLKKDPQGFCKKIYKFLGVDESFAPPSREIVILPAHKARIQWLAFLAQKIADRLRAAGRLRVVGFLKNQQWVEKILYRTAKERYVLSATEKEMILAYFRPKVSVLQSTLDVSLPEEWKINFP